MRLRPYDPQQRRARYWSAIARPSRSTIARSIRRRWRVADIAIIERLTAEHPLGVDLYRDAGDRSTALGLKVLSHSRPIPLSERVPVLENMGFRVVDERTYHIRAAATDRCLVPRHDARKRAGPAGGPRALKDRLKDCFLVVMGGQAENDGYNALVLAAGLRLARCRAACARCRVSCARCACPISQDYMWATLRKHAPIAAQIVSLFHARFDPQLGTAPAQHAAREAEIAAAIEAALAAVESLDEDRILRRFVNAVHGGDPHEFLSARRRRPAEGADRGQVRKPQARRPAAAAAAL